MLVEDSLGRATPEVELHFGTYEQAQKTLRTLRGSSFQSQKGGVSEILQRDGGRMLVLRFRFFGACPSEVLSCITGLVASISQDNPVVHRIYVPLFTAEQKT